MCGATPTPQSVECMGRAIGINTYLFRTPLASRLSRLRCGSLRVVLFRFSKSFTRPCFALLLRRSPPPAFRPSSAATRVQPPPTNATDFKPPSHGPYMVERFPPCCLYSGFGGNLYARIWFTPIGVSAISCEPIPNRLACHPERLANRRCCTAKEDRRR